MHFLFSFQLINSWFSANIAGLHALAQGLTVIFTLLFNINTG